MRSTTRFARVLVVGLITVVAAGVAWPRAAAAADRTTWEIQVVTTTGDVVAPVGKGPFEKAFGGGIYIGGACALPKGTTAFVDLRLEEVGDGGLASAPLASRKLDQGFVVTNTSKVDDRPDRDQASGEGRDVQRVGGRRRHHLEGGRRHVDADVRSAAQARCLGVVRTAPVRRGRDDRVRARAGGEAEAAPGPAYWSPTVLTVCESTAGSSRDRARHLGADLDLRSPSIQRPDLPGGPLVTTETITEPVPRARSDPSPEALGRAAGARRRVHRHGGTGAPRRGGRSGQVAVPGPRKGRRSLQARR